jgi:hypothetical protein
MRGPPGRRRRKGGAGGRAVRGRASGEGTIFRFVIPGQGPTNYAACVGSNLDGDAAGGDGLFFQNSKVRAGDVTDGVSNTVAFSESLLGPGGPNQTGATGDARSVYKLVTTSVTQLECDASTTLVTDRGALWADGAYNCGLYNHVLPPNSATMDCVRHSNPAWRAARSRHVGGVNVLLGDLLQPDVPDPGAGNAGHRAGVLEGRANWRTADSAAAGRR